MPVTPVTGIFLWSPRRRSVWLRGVGALTAVVLAFTSIGASADPFHWTDWMGIDQYVGGSVSTSPDTNDPVDNRRTGTGLIALQRAGMPTLQSLDLGYELIDR